MLVPIVRDRNLVILEVVDDTLLQRRESVIDDEVEFTITVEYCWKDCPGVAHRSGCPDAQEHFCSLHVHRSADVKLKKNVFATTEAGRFVQF